MNLSLATLAAHAQQFLQQRQDRLFPQADTANPFLEDVFAPVPCEVTEFQLDVVGELPRELDGVYARIGPNPSKTQAPRHYHWFVGDGMVHGVRLREGRALWYRNRWIGTDSVNRRLGRAPLPGRRRGMSDVVNTNVFKHAGRIWAATEAGVLPIELSEDLGSLRHGLFDSRKAMAYSAHPHLDPRTGDLHAVCYDAIKPWRVSYVRIDAKGLLDKVVHVPVRHGPMIHDCAVTASQVIVLDLPVTFSWRRFKEGSTLPYEWNASHAARVGLLPRDGTARDVRWFDVDPCYVFHTANAYDLPDGAVVLDVVVHRSMFDRSAVGPELDGESRFERWTLPAGGRTVQRQVIDERPQEFPRCDERLSAQPYRYAYAVESGGEQGGLALLRHDVHGGPSLRHGFGAAGRPGEFVFVPRHAQGAEDDGWLLGFVFNRRTWRSELHVLNAADLGGEPAAIVRLPAPVPMGFHGNWMAD